MQKNILVTGGYGFIGSNFVNYLLKNYDYNIKVFDKLTYASNLNNIKNDNIEFIKGDLFNKIDIEKALKDVDIIVNFAAESHVDRSIVDAHDFLNSNIYGVYNILDYMKENRNIEKFIHISTDEVYGNALNKKFDENSCLNPNNPYSATKASADLLILAYFKTYGIPVSITRSSNNYGPYQHPEKLIPKTIIYALLDKKIPIYGNGKNRRDWLYVDDNVKGIIKVMARGKNGEIYNIGSEIELENIEIVKKILHIMNKPESLIKCVNDRPGNDLRYSLDSSKLNALGFKPEVDINEGLNKTIDWYKNNKSWWYGKKNW
ncbi:dTDP-glucose 4,6-dehydratase [Acidiplasma aeolicum]|uniref:dTDP-glucose 4,6-dehydratase n=1 Tax=Acidiplasma aeolicum TaxID=507754 RepID=A0A0Q0RZ07_9ARCH|nr:dTDP-glucose 4,6-dehydratase [Acidiplasma aeolicum]KQB35627.1 dTDP-glucose 4,6-dehydratase [Acidiplasma aeolicum]